jgi:hypothetical protein
VQRRVEEVDRSESHGSAAMGRHSISTEMNRPLAILEVFRRDLEDMRDQVRPMHRQLLQYALAATPWCKEHEVFCQALFLLTAKEHKV